MKRILLVCDRPNWTFWTKSQAIVKNYTGSDFQFTITTTKENREKLKGQFDSHDFYVFLGWQNFSICERRYKISRDKSLVSVASHESWDNFATTPTNKVHPDPKVIGYLKTFRGVSAVSRRLQSLFLESGLENIALTPNGVPTEMFNPNYEWARDPNTLLCAYSGRDVDQKKGNRSIIEPAFEMVKGVFLKQAICDLRMEFKKKTRGNGYIPYEEMPGFYQTSDCLVCMSREEGSCRSVLEAMSCGCVIVSTDCGAIEELVIHEENGLIIDRSADALIDALNYLKANVDKIPGMKLRAREAVMKFDWRFVASHWHKWIMESIKQ